MMRFQYQLWIPLIGVAVVFALAAYRKRFR